jgi:hypothetical protein
VFGQPTDAPQDISYGPLVSISVAIMLTIGIDVLMLLVSITDCSRGCLKVDIRD